jgi:hypothetical protein
MRNGCLSRRKSGPVTNVWFYWARMLALGYLFFLLNAVPLIGADTPKPAEEGSSRPKAAEKSPDHELIQALLQKIEALEGRVAELESERSDNAASPASSGTSVKDSEPTRPMTAAVEPGVSVTAAKTGPMGGAPAPKPAQPLPASPDEGGHTMELPGGPDLKIRGFLDFNLGLGSAANALIYPLTTPPSTIHNSFQFGELDLFMSSRISSTLSFLGEVILGSDATNNWGLDVERAQINYKPSEFLQLSAGRMHTMIGFYNTAYHHGTWFQTTTGRPYMYYFEDSGGILPVHIVGLEASGLVPRSGKLNAHWGVQVGNGESSAFLSVSGINPVQNFLSDKNHKAFNISGFIKPDWARGLQIGANFYSDTRVPIGFARVNNSIPGLYLVYIKSPWEFLSEFELQRDHAFGSPVTYNTPLGYAQISHKFGEYRPYFRWQEVNVPTGDPLYSAAGRYEGPSFGVRMDFTSFAALKVQYNRIYTRNPLPLNGVDSQIAFTF